MNLDDPSRDIPRIHPAVPADSRPVVLESTSRCTPLPPGYANQSPHTRLPRRRVAAPTDGPRIA